MTHRIFIAINLPQNIKDKLGELILELKKENRRAEIKWVEPEILHLTLQFLGDLTLGQIETVKQILNQRVGESKGDMEFELGQIGAFPNLEEPRVIFVEAKTCPELVEGEDSGKLANLVKSIGDDLLSKGFEVDNRPWQSHITLGRVKTMAGKLKGIDHQFTDSQTWPAESIDLMESELASEGPQYRIWESYKLKK